MDLSSPLRSLIPSLDSAALEVLVGTESALSLARITDLARRGSRQGIAIVLQRLADDGLVLVAPANQGSLYTFNRDHVLAESVVRAAAARLEVVRRLREAVAQLSPSPVAVAIFGSFARGQGSVDSDIDLLVVVADDVGVHTSEWSDQIESLVSSATRWTGNRLEPLVLTVGAVRSATDAGEPLTHSLREEALPLIGEENLADLLGGEAIRPTRRHALKAARR